MQYGDLQFFDIIFFAGVAAFLIFRLRNVLGKRTGLEKQHKSGLEHKENTIKEKKVPFLVLEILSKISHCFLTFVIFFSFNVDIYFE